MQMLTLNIWDIREIAALHRYFAETLCAPSYYGQNLDALFDVLTSFCEPVRIVVRYAEAPQGEMRCYQPRVLRVFMDAAHANARLSVALQGVK